jgi:hypothetical protein
VTDQLEGLRRRYAIRVLPEKARHAFEEKLRLHEEAPYAYTTCPKCLGGYSRNSQFSECTHCCPHSSTIKGYLRQANGVCKGQLLCLMCGRRRDLFRGETDFIYDLCLRDNLQHNPHPCERCGSTTGTELQHWAPQAIFSDADQWPKAWLCPTCHRTWHDAMKAAHGVSLPRDQRARINILNPNLSRIAWGNAS